MAITERERALLYERLDGAVGKDAADALMGLLPPVGWADVATRRDIDGIGPRFESIHYRFDSVDERFAQMDRRFELIDERFAQMDRRFELIDERFAQMDRRFELIDERFAQMDRRFELIDERFAQMDRRFELIDERFEAVDRRFDDLEQRLAERITSEIGQAEARFERAIRQVTLSMMAMMLTSVGLAVALTQLLR